MPGTFESLMKELNKTDRWPCKSLGRAYHKTPVERIICLSEEICNAMWVSTLSGCLHSFYALKTYSRDLGNYRDFPCSICMIYLCLWTFSLKVNLECHCCKLSFLSFSGCQCFLWGPVYGTYKRNL